MTGIRKKDLKQFKELLLVAKNKILEQFDFDKEQINDLSKKEIGDIVDKAFYAYEKSKTIDMLEKEKKNLQAIEHALIRVEKSTYGKCLLCGKGLDIKRLQAIPWATSCINSAECLNK